MVRIERIMLRWWALHTHTITMEKDPADLSFLFCFVKKLKTEKKQMQIIIAQLK